MNHTFLYKHYSVGNYCNLNIEGAHNYKIDTRTIVIIPRTLINAIDPAPGNGNDFSTS